MTVEFDLTIFSQWLAIFAGGCGMTAYVVGYKLAIIRRFFEISTS